MAEPPPRGLSDRLRARLSSALSSFFGKKDGKPAAAEAANPAGFGHQSNTPPSADSGHQSNSLPPSSADFSHQSRDFLLSTFGESLADSQQQEASRQSLEGNLEPKGLSGKCDRTPETRDSFDKRENLQCEEAESHHKQSIVALGQVDEAFSSDRHLIKQQNTDEYTQAAAVAQDGALRHGNGCDQSQSTSIASRTSHESTATVRIIPASAPQTIIASLQSAPTTTAINSPYPSAELQQAHHDSESAATSNAPRASAAIPHRTWASVVAGNVQEPMLLPRMAVSSGSTPRAPTRWEPHRQEARSSSSDPGRLAAVDNPPTRSATRSHSSTQALRFQTHRKGRQTHFLHQRGQ